MKIEGLEDVRVTPIGVVADPPKGIAKEIDAANAAVAEFRERVAKQADFNSKFRDADAMPGDAELANQVRNSTYDLMMEAVRHLRTLAGLNVKYRAALAKLRDKANDELLAVEAEVRKQLLDFGYHEQQEGVVDPCSLWPAFVIRHPRVFAARSRAQELAGHAGDTGFAQTNEKELSAVEAAIVAYRRRLAAV